MKVLHECKFWMKESCPGWPKGLSATMLVVVTFVFMTFASAVQAQFHGAQIQKQCTTPVRNCVDADDCSDGNLCTDDICDTTLPRTTSCNIRATNADENGDTVTVTEAFDEITTAGGVVRIPDPSGNLLVSAIGGDVTCNVGDPLPCTLNTFDSFVEFNSQYTLTDADSALAVLPDQGTVTYVDNCDDPDTTNCSTAPNTVQATASTTVEDACSNGPEDPCDDDNACTADSCDPATGECINAPPTECDDGNACTEDSCDPATGECVNVDDFDCDDDNACTDDSCDPGTGACVNEDNIDCDDGNPCTDDSCDPATGACVNEDNIDCDDQNACTDDSCDPATGGCVNEDNIDCDDGNPCTDDSCDPATGECVNEDNIDCDDGDACTDDSCDPATGGCVNEDNIDCDDGDACTEDSCDPASGECVNGPPTDCDDGDVCTDDSCDPATGECVNVPAEPLPSECFQVTDICRTPGFWKTHAGNEKPNRSWNVTQAVIDASAFQELYVCGTTIDNTDVGNSHSALEAMCIKGPNRQAKLVRQLTAAALNCVMSGGAGDCMFVDTVEPIYTYCNTVCDEEITSEYSACIEAIDEWNNGLLGDQLCHERDLCPDFADDGEINGSALCFEPTGAAGSTRACKQAARNRVSVP